MSLGAGSGRYAVEATVTYGYLWMTEPGLDSIAGCIRLARLPKQARQLLVLFETHGVFGGFTFLLLFWPALDAHCRGAWPLFVRIFLNTFGSLFQGVFGDFVWRI